MSELTSTAPARSSLASYVQKQHLPFLTSLLAQVVVHAKQVHELVMKLEAIADLHTILLLSRANHRTTMDR